MELPTHGHPRLQARYSAASSERLDEEVLAPVYVSSMFDGGRSLPANGS